MPDQSVGYAGDDCLLGCLLGLIHLIGFVIASEPAADLVYVTGDTVWFTGTADVARRFAPSVVLLALRRCGEHEGPFHLTMDTNDAVEATVAFPRAAIVPVHHTGWAHFTQSQDDLLKTFEVLGWRGRVRPVSPASSITVLSDDVVSGGFKSTRRRPRKRTSHPNAC